MKNDLFRRLWLRIGLVLIGTLLLAQPLAAKTPPLVDASAEQAPPEARCVKAEEFAYIAGLGNACQLPDGMWKVMLDDGTILDTHGPDPATRTRGIVAPEPNALNSAFVCAGGTDYHALLLYVHASDVASQYTYRVGTIRTYAQQMQDKLNSESLEFGVSSALKYACDSNGQVSVRDVRLNISSAQHDIGSITNDLKALGFNSQYEKYWMVYEQPNCGGGVAWIVNDDRPVTDNWANSGPSYAISWGFCNFDTLMHEAGHSMGAVQNSAPNTTNGLHCIDGNDIMCYNDGASRGNLFNPNVCTDRQHFDCNHNDYFHPSPPAGSYLATHWNIAACYNRFIVRSGCGTNPPPPPPSGDNGYFSIVNRSSNLCLDVSSSSTADKAIVQQWTCNNSGAQQWQLLPTGGGSYMLKARVSGKCLDLPGWNGADGVILEQYTCGNNQTNQSWNLERVADGWVRMGSVASGKYVSIVSGSVEAGADTHTWPWLGNPDQQWRIQPVGASTLINVNSNRCVDVASSGTADGTNIRQWNCNSSNAQKWSFVHIDNGYYRVQTAINGKAMEVQGGSTGNGANVQLWTATNLAHHQWRIEPTGAGNFYLVARHSGQLLDISGGGTGDGVNIQQWPWNGSAAQRFRITN